MALALQSCLDMILLLSKFKSEVSSDQAPKNADVVREEKHSSQARYL